MVVAAGLAAAPIYHAFGLLSGEEEMITACASASHRYRG